MRICVLGLILSMIAGLNVVSATKYAVSFTVVDDVGTPVEGAKVGVTGEMMRWTQPTDQFPSEWGVSDAQGRVLLQGKSDVRRVAYAVERSGHYWMQGADYFFDKRTLFRWQPWNPTIPVVLKRIRNPVPMYAKNLRSDIPSLGDWVGYDLAVGDWVEPWGKGQLSDVEFHSTASVVDRSTYEGTVDVRFPGKGNGLCLIRITEQPGESGPRLPYLAPEGSYQSHWEWFSERRRDSSAPNGLVFRQASDKSENFFIRIRSQYDEEDKLVSAWYGKIHGPISIDPRGRDYVAKSGKVYVGFSYYVNPDGTRNVEFDPKQNLLKPRTRREESLYRGLGP